MMSTLAIYCLGSPQVELDDQPVFISNQKAIALLVYLAVTGTTQRREALATLFWPDYEESRARTYLRQALYALTKVLGHAWFETSRQSMGLHPDADLQVDVHQFQDLCKVSEQVDGGAMDPAAVAQIEAAVALYQGHFLEGFTLPDCPAFDEWCRLQQENLRQQLVQILQALVEYYKAQHDYKTAIAHAYRWLSLDPVHEPAHRALMRLYVCSGDRAAALRQYEACVQVLDDDLGILPEEETTALFEAIRSRRFSPGRDGKQPGEVPRDEEEEADGQALAPPPFVELSDAADDGSRRTRSNLPAQSTPLVGRAQDLSAILHKLQDVDCRLLTLVGPGGIGKTRLAIAVAASQEVPVVYVPLQAVSSPEFIAPAIADAAGIRLDGQDPLPVQLLNHLRRKHLLLVLDNFEHLLAGTDLLGKIVHEAPHVKLLVTSRAALSVREEWLYRVAGLPVPPQDEASQSEVDDPAAYGAVQLFDERARQMRHDFNLEEEVEAVVSICRQVEGMPLAIELAASWAAALDCANIADRLHRSLDILSTPLRNVPERHQSIHATFKGSWQMLSAEERDTFMQLAVFSGGFTVQAAEEVAGATLPLMSALVAKALVRREANGRYEIHELLRQYGAEKLAASPEREAAAHGAHGAFFMRFLADRRHQVRSPRQRQAAEEIGDDLENVRKAWQWALDHLEIELLHNASNVLLDFCQLQSRYLEGAGMFLEASRHLDSDDMGVERDAALVEILTHYSWLCLRLGRLADVDRALARACRLYDEHHIMSNPQFNGNPLLAATFLALTRGEYAQATDLGERVLQELAEHEHAVPTAIPHYGMASAAMAQGDYPRAKVHGRHGLAIAVSAGNQWEATFLHSILGQVAVAEEDLLAAKQHYEAAYAICEELADPGGMAEHLANLADVALRLQEWPDAVRLYRRSYRLYQEIGDRGGIARTQLGMGIVSQKTGEPDAAAKHYRRALTVAMEAQVTPVLLSVLAAVGDFLLPDDADQALGVRILSFVLHHPACDARIRRRVLDSLDRWAVSAHEVEPRSDTLEQLVATLQIKLATRPENHMRT